MTWPAASPLAALALAALVGGCGTTPPPRGALAREGRGVFRSAGCGGCHTLTAVGAHGREGPDFDRSERLTRPQIIQSLNAGSGDMPSFRARLSDREEEAVAEFLHSEMNRR